MRFVFYDTETTGTDTVFDQILQFAAILTDDELHELDRFNIRCQLLPHVVPSPSALRATRVRPSLLTNSALPSHYEMMSRVTQALHAWSPAVFIGYNSLAFDEPLLRQALFQSLQPVYLTNTNRNSRADVYRLVQAASVYAPNSIVVPLNEDGKQTRRLDRIAPANGFDHDNAHEAMADVEATIFMAALIKKRCPEIWNSLMALTSKPTVIGRAFSGDLLFLTEFYGGKPYTRCVVGCGQNPEYDAQVGLFDLRFDPKSYIDLSVNELISVMKSTKKAVRSVQANKLPILLSADLAPELLADLALTRHELERRKNLVIESRDFKARVGQALAGRFEPGESSPYVEAQIYDGFTEWKDKRLLDEFHNRPWETRPAILEKIGDPRLRELGERLIYTEHPEVLTKERRAQLDDWKSERLLTEGPGVPWRTVSSAFAEVTKLIEECPHQRDDLLVEVQSWLATKMAEKTTANVF